MPKQKKYGSVLQSLGIEQLVNERTADYFVKVTMVNISEEQKRVTVNGVDIYDKSWSGIKVEPISGILYIPTTGQWIRVRRSANTEPRMVGQVMDTRIFDALNVGQGDMVIDAYNTINMIANDVKIYDRSILDTMYAGGGLNYIQSSGFDDPAQWTTTQGADNTVTHDTTGNQDDGSFELAFTKPGDKVTLESTGFFNVPNNGSDYSLSVCLDGEYRYDDVNQPLRGTVKLYEQDSTGDRKSVV
jgi:hypothetical protein